MGKENQLAGLTKNKGEVKGGKVSEMQSAEGRRTSLPAITMLPHAHLTFL